MLIFLQTRGDRAVLIWDSLPKISYEIYKPQQHKTDKTSQHLDKTKNLSDKKTMDWFLQTALEPKIHFSNTSTHVPKNPINIYANLLDKNQTKNPIHQEFKSLSSSEKEILQEITNYSYRYRQNLKHLVKELNIQSCDYGGNLDRKEFIKKIDSKLKPNATRTITFQEANESQRFLESKMDKIMLEIYQENPQIIQEMINKNYYYTDNTSISSNEVLKENEKISSLLLEYGIRTESIHLEDKLKCFLSAIPMALKNSIDNKEVDMQTLKRIEENINFYRERKIEATGHKLFASVAERFSDEEQEQITDSIANILSFYLEPNSLETNGYKISWQPQHFNTKENPLSYGMHTALSNIPCADIEIAFQMLLVFPTKL